MDEKARKIIELALILFALFLLVQIVKVMAGGSWSSEDIIIGLLIFNLGSVFTIGLLVAQLKSDHNYLKNQFKSLAGDFKLHIKKKNNY